jgi:hypothetical protein
LPAAGAGGAGGTSGLTGGAAARAVAGYAAAAAGSNTLPNAAGLSYAAALANAEAEASAHADREPLDMPDPADKPPLTPEQMERLTALHARIAGLQTELAAAMAEAETVLARPVMRRADAQPRPELVDRRL